MDRATELKVGPRSDVLIHAWDKPLISDAGDGALYAGRIVVEVWERDGLGGPLVAILSYPTRGTRKSLVDRAVAGLKGQARR